MHMGDYVAVVLNFINTQTDHTKGGVGTCTISAILLRFFEVHLVDQRGFMMMVPWLKVLGFFTTGALLLRLAECWRLLKSPARRCIFGNKHAE